MDTLNDYMQTTMTDKLPTSLTIDGVDYHLMETCTSEHDKHFPNWWSFEYRRYDGKSLPPEVHSKTEWYYLCSIAPTKEEAYKQLLEKVNNMVDE